MYIPNFLWKSNQKTCSYLREFWLFQLPFKLYGTVFALKKKKFSEIIEKMWRFFSETNAPHAVLSTKW